MRGAQYLTKPEQFAAVYNQGKSWANKLIVIKTLPNGLTSTRYGISVSSRVGGAVVRNRIKRRLREILKHYSLQAGWDIVIIVRPTVITAKYDALWDSVHKLMARAGLPVSAPYRQEMNQPNESTSPGAD